MVDADIKKLDPAENLNNLKRLRLSTNKIKHEESLRSILVGCSMLEILCLHYHGDNGQLLCSSFSLLPHLKVLSLWFYNLASSKLQEIADDLPPRLEVLSLPNSKMSNIQELLYLLSQLPTGFKHLDVCWNNYGSDILEITKVKKQLPNLQRLNIGSMSDKDGEHIAIPDYEEYINTVREELQQDNSEIRVYCDDEEEVWYMYR